MSGIRVELELQDGSFTTRMLHAGESVRTFVGNVNGSVVGLRRAEDASRSLLSVTRDLTVSLGMAGAALNTIKNILGGALIQDLIKTNAEFERLTVLMKGMSSAADPVKDAANQVKFLRDFAKQAPFSIQALTDVFVRLKATGIDPTAGSMRALVDAVAASGGTEEQLKRAALAMSQMAGKGVIQLEELRQQLGEAVPRSAELMARGIGVTYSQLITAIGRGTVEAKPALEAMRLEFERTFGGAAAQQMNTFNGLVQQIKTQYQTFQLAVGEAGFFDAIKTQLADVNRLLGSNSAQAFARQLGAGLTTAVGYIRSFIDSAIEMSGMIMRVGEILLYAFGGAKILQVMGALGSSLAMMRTQMALTMQQAAMLGTTVTGAVSAMTAGTAASAMFAGAAGRLAQGTSLLLGTLMRLGPQALLLGGAVLAVADYFGLFSNKARDAWQELERFGATSKKQVDDAGQYLAQRESELQALYRQRDRLNAIPGTSGDLGTKKFGEDIAKREAELKSMREKLSQESEKIEQDSSDRIAQRELRRLEEQAAIIRQQNDRLSTLEAQKQSERIKQAANQKKSIEGIEREYAENRKKMALAAIDEELALYRRRDQEIERLMDQSGQSSESRRALQIQWNAITDNIKRLTELRNQTDGQNFGKISEIAKPVDIEKALERGNQLLTNMKADAASLGAQLGGARGEAEKLAFQLERGKFGDPNDPRVRRLIEQLKEAQVENDKLQDAIEGRNKFERDATNLEAKLKEQIFDEQTKDLSEVDKLRLRVQEGFYKGVNLNTPMQRATAAINVEIQAATQAAASFGQTFMQVFAENGTSAADRFLGKLKEITGTLTSMSSGAGGLFSGIGSSMQQFFGGGGVSGNYLQRLIGAESGGDPNAAAKTSSAVGLGQFIETTWLQFIREMKPGLLGLNRDAMMDLRKNPEMMKQAIMWYANQNAGVLSQAGLAATDANVYLAHFLGPKGALAALKAPLNAMLTDVLDPKTISANPFLKDWNAMQLQAWSQKKMGVGMTWNGMGSAPTPTGSPPIAQAAGIGPMTTSGDLERLKQLEERLKALKLDGALKTEMDELKRSIVKVGEEAGGTANRVAEIKKRIREGAFGADTDPDSERYRELIRLAQEWDKADNQAQTNKKLRQRLDTVKGNREKEAEIIAEKEQQIRRLQQNQGGGMQFSDGLFRKMAEYEREKQLIQELVRAKQISEADGRLLEQQGADQINRLRSLEIQEYVMGEQKKVQSVREGLMTTEQARQAEHDREIQRLQDLLNMTGITAEQRATIEQTIQAKIATFRQQTAAQSPIGRQMKEWSDLGGNMQKAMTGWMDSAVDAFANFVVTGKADFKSLIQSILSDITKIALKGLIGNIMGGSSKGGVPGKSGKAGAAGKAGKAAGGPLKLFGIAHTGGIIGSLRGGKFVNPAVFAGAPRFHTGGIVGGLTKGEVPIIAKKGEGVFTPEQMKALGGGSSTNQVITLAPSINVNSTGGKPEENQDLADKIGQTVQSQMRAMITTELRQQMRPGGLLNSPGR